jgi:glycosyltransferase involved in cell wall biosynthesis
MEQLINIIMPVYNSEKWISKSIESVISQTYKNWKLIILEDCSSDQTVAEIMNFRHRNKNIILRKNPTRMGPVQNQYTGIIQLMDPDSIIVHLDGDDWLNDPDVFNVLNETYKDSNIWATYGNYRCLSRSTSICRPMDGCDSMRRSIIGPGGWRFSHLRTYRSNLFKYIRKNDLMKDRNHFLEAAADVAIFLPILELAGHKRIKFIDRINVVYNDLNPLCEATSKRITQITSAEYMVHAIEPYHPLPEGCSI